MTARPFSEFDPSLRDEPDDFGGGSAGAVEDRPLSARLLDAVVDAGLPGDWGRLEEVEPS